VALSKVTKENLFLKQVLETMGIMYSLPFSVKVDNVGAIHFSNNFSLHQCTKHIEISCHFVREFMEDGVLETTNDFSVDIYAQNKPDHRFENISKGIYRM
jgi:hypothetical protein